MNQTVLKKVEEIDEPIINIKKDSKQVWKDILKYLLHTLIIAVILVLTFFSMKQFELAKPNEISPKAEITIATFACWIAEYLILKGITGKTKLSLGIVVSVELAFDAINYIIRAVRGSAITISDIVAIRTGLSVVKNINFKFDMNFLWGILIAIAAFAILIIFRKKIISKKENLQIRVIRIIIGLSIAIWLLNTNIYSKYSIWDINENYRVQGTPITILRMLQDFIVTPPEGYNKKEAENILASYESSDKSNEDTPNIIVIVNESFCDFNKLYKNGEADPIEYFNKLMEDENVISGTMYSSEYGGGTANVEYEFLTQNSTRILPVGSYVFQQYISQNVKTSIVQNLKEQGYKTSAIHPWENYAYSRNKIYQLFGFDTIKFKNDIEGLEKNFNNEFYSDRSTYKELMRQINEKQEGEKLFEYVLTVQNHTGFNNPDPNQTTYSEKNDENVYMQLTHESTEALKEVLDELKQKDEKYILLFFGDHQPNLDYVDNFTERPTEKYEIPFVIWANYEIEGKHNIKTSTIYLQNYLLKAAGVNFSTMNNYMEELQKYYPVITRRFYMAPDGNVYKNEDDGTDNFVKLQEYDKIDYYNIFD